MNPPPTPPNVPFGDPTAVRAANKSNVGKGIALGCGGCAIIIVAIVVVIGVIAVGVLGALRSSDACNMTLNAANASADLKKEIGAPITLGMMVGGQVNVVNSHHEANVTMTLVGPNGEADAHAIGTREGSAPWIFTEMSAVVKANGTHIDLRGANP